MLPTEILELEINVPVKMRDGTLLYADIIRPAEKGRYPAILTRLPYDKSIMFGMRPGYKNPHRVARAGYAVVMQDCRATGASEGEKFYPWYLDAEDGYDTIEWIASQPWCNGKIGMYGSSNLGSTQWQAGALKPPHLKTICPAATSSEVPFCRNGVFQLGASLMWYLAQSRASLSRVRLKPMEMESLSRTLSAMAEELPDMFRFLPLKDMPLASLKGTDVGPFYKDWLAHMEDQDYWNGIGSPAPIEKIEIPVFQISGWYCHLNDFVLKDYVKIQASRERNKTAHRLMIGPWQSAALDGDATDITGLHIRWFDYWLKDIDNGMMDESPVSIFILGDNVWRDENEWPLARTSYTRYYFHSKGRANSRFGDGKLNTNPPENQPSDIYLYDPRGPVPTRSGIIIGPSDMPRQNQQEVEEREDILVYTSEPLQNDVEVTGPIKIMLWASSSSPDTDFTGKLVDVFPDGTAFNLVEGITRARYRESPFMPKLLIPDKIYEYTIDLGATSNVFKAGHCIRVEISSSNFPKYDRNLNTGHPIGQDAEIKVALQTVFHKQQYPSYILLPIIPC